MRIGSSDQQRSIFSEILSACRAKIENCIKGGNPQNTRISQFSAFIDRLSGFPAPAYISELENFPYAGGIFVYTRGKAEEAFVNLVTALRLFLAKTQRVIDGTHGDYSLVSSIAAAAAAIRGDAVFMALLDKCHEAEDACKAKRFIERIANYHIALRTIWRICKKSGKSEWPFPKKIAVELLPPKRRQFRPPTVGELWASMMPEDRYKFLRIPTAVRQSLPSGVVDLKEHCEVQLVRFYLENDNRAPVVPYLGVSKLSCSLCCLFLKKLQAPKLPGQVPPIEFNVRGEHGKIYGRWLPPDDIVAEADIQGRVLQSLHSVSAEIQIKVQERLKSWVRLPLGGDSPDWLSDEDADSTAKSPSDGFGFWRETFLPA